MSMDWISVKDRLPEGYATYLVYVRNWHRMRWEKNG